MLRFGYVLLVTTFLSSCTKTVDSAIDPGTDQPTIVAHFHNTVDEPFSAVLGTEGATFKTGSRVTIFVGIQTIAEEIDAANISLRDGDSQEVLATFAGSEVMDVVMIPGFNPGREDNISYYSVSFNLDAGYAHRNMDIIADINGLATAAQIQMSKAFMVIE